MVINEKITSLYKTFEDSFTREYAPYTPKFTESNPAIYDDKDIISLDNLLSTLVESKVFDKDSAVPEIRRQGRSRLTVKPKLLGGKMPTTYDDGANARTGQATIINGQTVNNEAYETATKLAVIKTGILNGIGNMSGEVLLTSKCEILDLDYDTGNISNKGNLTVSASTGETTVVKISKLYRNFFARTGRIPKILVGDNVVDQIISEINAPTGRKDSNKGSYEMITNPKEGVALKIDTMSVPLEIIAPVKKLNKTDNVSGTDNLIQLYSPDTLVLAYAVIPVVVGGDKTGSIVGNVGIYEGGINYDTARSSIYVKSSPLSVVVDNNLIERYQLVVS